MPVTGQNELLSTESVPGSFLPFGAGCLSFEYHDLPSTTISWDEYFALLQATIERIPGSSQHRIRAENKTWDTITSPAKRKNFCDGGQPFPSMSGVVFDVNFGISIPEEVVDAYRASNYVTGRMSTRYGVMIGERISGPYAVISSWEPTDAAAHGFSLVAKYLASHLNVPHSRIWIESLGPSPYQSDFLLQPTPGSGPLIQVFPNPTRSFPLVLFTYDPAVFVGTREAFKLILHTLPFELAIYYQCVHTNIRIEAEWSELASGADKLVKLVGSRGLKGWWSRLRHLGLSTSSLDIGLATTEIMEAFEKSRLTLIAKTNYTGGEPYCLLNEIQTEIDSQTPRISSQFARIIKVAEVRHAQTVQWTSVTIAALVGAGAGFLASILSHI